MLAFLRTNTMFCLSVALCLALVWFIPQVKNVMLQTVQTPAVDPVSAGWWEALGHKSTREAAGFLFFLALLFTGGTAAAWSVIPPSTVTDPPPPPGRLRTSLGLLVVLLLPVLVLLRAPAWLVLAALVLLLWPLARWLIDRYCAGLCRLVSAWLVPGDSVRWVAAMIPAILGLLLLAGSRWYSPINSPYPLADCVLTVLGLLLVGLAVWYLLGNDIWLLSPSGPSHAAIGRGLAWLLLSFGFGEAIWAMAYFPKTSEWVSFRLYTIWAVLQVAVLVILGASLLDTLEREREQPFRIVGLFALAVVAFFADLPGPETLAAPPVPASPVLADPDQWATYLKRRIDAIPKDGPIVLVASSGGGSRAAIFTGLVLDALSREPFQGRAGTTWGDHVVLVSGVSGGSLGSARYISGLGSSALERERPDLRNSVRLDLAERMTGKASQLLEQLESELQELEDDARLHSDGVRELRKRPVAEHPEELAARESDLAAADKRVTNQKDLIAAARRASDYCQWFRAEVAQQGSDKANALLTDDVKALSWVVRSAVMDDLCTDFMAPVLRGALTPRMSRSEALRRFWVAQFGWETSLDRTGYGAMPTYDWAKHPLAIYNTCDVRRGCRLAVGFPPLPPFFLTRGVTRKPGSDKDDWQPRNPPEALGDVDPDRMMPLADAVALSANFPFGFNVVTIARNQLDDRDYRDRNEADDQRKDRQARQRKTLDEKDDLVVKLLDGGIVDNTGIDSLALALGAIHEKARQPVKEGQANIYQEIWRELLRRRVYLIEIDSGAKPEKPGPATRRLSVLFDPLGALNNAGFTNAARDKQHHLSALGDRLSQGVDLSGPLARMAADGSPQSDQEATIRAKLLQQQVNGVRRFTFMTFDANHFEGSNVMTAWSLAPDDKALLLARFVTELLRGQGGLGQLADLSRISLDDDAKSLREEADHEVSQALKNRDRFLVQRSLEQLKDEFTRFDQLRQQSKPSSDALVTSLESIEKRLKDVQSRAEKARIDDRDTTARLKELTGKTALAVKSLKKGVAPDKALAGYTIAPTGTLGNLWQTLNTEQTAAIKTSLNRLDSAGKTQQVQKDLSRIATESRKVFDKPPVKKK